MLPLLAPDTSPSPLHARYLAAIADRGFSGEIETGPGHLLVQSTDNSIYQVLPDAVVYPRGVDDLRILARVSAEAGFAGIVLRPRGGGTGTNGQALGAGVVVDLSRHMNRIVSIDPERRIAVVEAGVVKDQLQAALRSHGLFFPPELSTSNRATIGGMISTDASGQGSIVYGKTRAHVRGVTMVLRDGSLLESAGTPLPGSLGAEIVLGLDGIERDYAALWVRTVPTLNRSVTGYDLGHLRADDGTLDVNAVLCGSEGTLGMIATATLALTPIPRHAALVTITYPDFLDMLSATRELMAFGAGSIEVIDGRVLDLARRDRGDPLIAAAFPDGSDGKAAGGAAMVEFFGDDRAEIERRIAALEIHLAKTGGSLGHAVIREHEAIAAIWTMRKRAVGLLANVEGKSAPVPFVEDTAVPPERLRDYLADFRALLDREGLAYGMFGHADAGVLHVRPDLDLTDPASRALVRRISDAVFELTRAYGGVLWGEHGKGVRGTYAPAFFGPVYPAMQAIKALFDPQNQYNPGKIASPDGTALLDIDGVATRGAREEGLPRAVTGDYGRAFSCNGNGACFDFDFDAVMCPSWKATRDRRFSPKGRATLMREWLRLLDGAGFDARAVASRGLLALPARALATVRAKPDFSREVKTVMEGCLGCKGCSGTCPVKVDVPEAKSRFLALYHSRYLRPLSDHLMGGIEGLLPLARRAGPFYNLLSQSGPGRRLLEMIGIVALPAMPRVALSRELRARGAAIATPARLAALSPKARADSVVLVADPFSEAFSPHVLLDAVDLVRHLGLRAFIVTLPNGKPAHAKGMLDRFARVARRTRARLDALAATGAVLVGIEPAMTLVFRDEYGKAQGTAAPVLLVQEWLATQGERISARAGTGPVRFVLAPHCSETAIAPAATAAWVSVFAAAGAQLRILRLGCCGMAGTFGHEAGNRAVSRRIYGLSWADRVNAPNEEEALLATGFSCRCQAEKESGRVLAHPISALLARMRT